MLTLYRRLIALRKSAPALIDGAFRFVPGTPRDCLVYTRESAAQRLLVALNFSAEPREIKPAAGSLVMSTNPDRAPERVEGALQLGADEGAIVETSA
jgi:alpha-glucosidase